MRCQVDHGLPEPAAASTVRLMRSSRDWVRTMMVTSSGMRFHRSAGARSRSRFATPKGSPLRFSLKPTTAVAPTLCSTLAARSANWLPSRVGARPDGLLGMAAGLMVRLVEVARKGLERYVFGGGVGEHHQYTSIGFSNRRASGNGVGHGDGRAWGWPTALRVGRFAAVWP